MEKWEGKTAVVTGASSGIGDAIARDLVKYGINVVALARRMERLESLKEQLKDEKGRIIPIKCDVCDRESIDAAFEQIEKEVGTFQILVNNAGVAALKLMFGDDESVEEVITNTINTNFLGLVRVTRKAYKLMKKSDDYGIIINIGSIGGHNASMPVPLNVYPGETYFVRFSINSSPILNFKFSNIRLKNLGTKFAVRAVTESMRQELINLKDSKIRVCEISPGAVESELTADFFKAPEVKQFTGDAKVQIMKASELSQTVLFMLMTPYEVNITEIIVRPTCGS